MKAKVMRSSCIAAVLFCNRKETAYETSAAGEWKRWNRRCPFCSQEETEKF
jgi:hypothetical protein